MLFRSKHEEEYLSSDAFYKIPRRLQCFFKFVIDCETYEEYELSAKNYDLYWDNWAIKKENGELKKEIKSLKRFNDLVLSSTSWKITEPFRKFMNMFR